jgi:hypothetical protein
MDRSRREKKEKNQLSNDSPMSIRTRQRSPDASMNVM